MYNIYSIVFLKDNVYTHTIYIFANDRKHAIDIAKEYNKIHFANETILSIQFQTKSKYPGRNWDIEKGA